MVSIMGVVVLGRNYMKLEKKDIAKTLGLKYIGDDTVGYYDYHVFLFNGATVLVGCYRSIEDAWEEASGKVLEPLIEFISKSL